MLTPADVRRKLLKLQVLLEHDQDLFGIDSNQISDTNVIQTVVGGRVVYDRSKQGSEDTEVVDDTPAG